MFKITKKILILILLTAFIFSGACFCNKPKNFRVTFNGNGGTFLAELKFKKSLMEKVQLLLFM